MSLHDAAPGTPEAGPAERKRTRGVSGVVTLMLLRLGKRWFAMDVRAIEEVALKGQVTRVPMAPSHILGVITLRGRLVTVVGLEQMIGGSGMLPSEDSATLPRLLIVREEGYEMAVVVEEIHGMIEHSEAPREPPAPGEDVPEFVREEFEWQGHRVRLLDARMLVAAVARLAGIQSPWQDVAQ
jgi:purine-binding chemotaxis protein CheW